MPVDYDKWPVYECIPPQMHDPNDFGKTGLWHPNEEHIMAYLFFARVGWERSSGSAAFREHVLENVYIAMVRQVCS